MAQGRDTGRGGRGARGGRASQGGRAGRGSSSPSVPKRASELEACKELEGHIFTIDSGNKGKDEDMLCTSKEKMATYIGTKYGNEAAQEWTSKKRIVSKEPKYSDTIEIRHAKRVQATKRLNCKLTSLTAS